MTRSEKLRRAAIVATSLTLGTILALGAWIGLRIRAGSVDIGFRADAGGIFFVAVVVVVTIGAGYFTYRVPDHVVPWLLLGVAGSVGVGQLAFAISEDTDGAIRWVTGMASYLGWWPPIALGLVFLPLLFPTGRPPTRRWRWVGWAGVVSLTGSAAWYGVAVARDCITCDRLGIGWLDAEYAFVSGLMFMSAIVAVASLVVRYRRSTGVERKQLQWLLLPLAVGLVGFVQIGIKDNLVAGIFLAAGALGVPIGIVIAITRHRLYEIDRVVSRTISYAVVVGASSLLFAAGAIWLPQRLTGAGNNLAVAGSTIAVAALFNPMRRRVTRAVDRRFHRLPYEADEVVAGLRRHLRGETDVSQVAASFESASSVALSPESATVWVRDRQ